MTLYYILFVVGIIALVLALVLLIWPRFPAVVPAYAGMLCLHLSTFIYLRSFTLIFWGVAAAIVLMLKYMSPKGEPDGHSESNLYVGLSTIAGAMLGLVISPSLIVLGAIIGSLIGVMAYSRTPRGKWINPPSAAFFQYVGTKCLPAVVTVSIVGITVEGFIFY